METLQTFLDRAGGNAMYTSKMAVVEFVNALGTWVEESLLKRFHKAPFFSIMADECTDITALRGADNLLLLSGEWCTRRTLH